MQSLFVKRSSDLLSSSYSSVRYCNELLGFWKCRAMRSPVAVVTILMQDRLYIPVQCDPSPLASTFPAETPALRVDRKQDPSMKSRNTSIRAE